MDSFNLHWSGGFGMKATRWVGATTAITSAFMVLGLMAPAGVAAAAPPNAIDGTMGSRCVGHYGATAGDTFKVVWRDGGGALVARRNVTVTHSVWSVCVSDHRLSAGDTIKATNDAGTNELTVPELTMAVNRVQGYVSGRGPAGDVIRAHCNFSGGFEPCMWHDGVRVGPNGYWAANLNWDVMGGESYYAVWRSADDNRVTLFAQAPFVNTELGTAEVSGALAPGKTRTIYLYDASMMRKGKAVVTGSLKGTSDDGSFDALFRDTAGNPVEVAPGDTVDGTRIASNSESVVPVINATATASNDRVTGECGNTPSSAGYAHVSLYRTGHLRGYARYQGDGQNGVFSFNFRHLSGFDDEANVKPGDRLVIDCIQHDGDGVVLTIYAN
jgi:hypothetical protein